jgi:chemotaxis regulatin CheY-phosphate phosphatase CheZ
MPAKPPSELLYDSEATFRLVDSALESIREPEPERTALRDALARQEGEAPDAANTRLFDPLRGGPVGLLGLSQILARSYAEIVSVLGSLRESRSLLEKTAVDRLQHTHAKLREVSSATETAATSILDGLERCLGMVDQLDASAADADASVETRSQLRDALFMLMGHMQFQDITTQQINYASSVLTDMESRLAQLAAVLDPASFGARGAQEILEQVEATHFDPAASTQNAEQRQAVADEVFEQRITRL